MTSPSALNLSNEILLQIFGHFCLHCQGEYNQSWDHRPFRSIEPRREKQQPDAKSWYSIDRHALFSLSLTSKRFRDLAQPILYHEFTLGYGDSWLSQSYTWGGRLASFIRTLARRPDLARLIKVMYIHTYLFGRNDDENRTVYRAVIQEAASALGMDLPAVWRQRVSNISDIENCDWPGVYEVFLGSYLDGKSGLTERQERHLHRAITEGSSPGWRWMNAELVAVLIAQSPQLDYLSLQGAHQWPSSGLPISALPALGISSLPLKTLDLGIGAGRIIELASGLETLNLHQTGTRFGGSIPEMPRLRTLRLTDFAMSDVMLRRLLGACTGGLVAFEYEAEKDESPSCGYTPHSPSDHFQPADAIESLEIHKSTLRVLHLDLSKRGLQMLKIPPTVNLKGFPALKHVFINSISLFGLVSSIDQNVDSQALLRFLPSSIVSLAIWKNGERDFVKESLLGLADRKSRYPDEFPNLNWVACSYTNESSTLASLFGAAGVDFSTNVLSLNEVKPYLNGPNASSDLHLPNWDSDDDL